MGGSPDAGVLDGTCGQKVFSSCLLLSPLWRTKAEALPLQPWFPRVPPKGSVMDVLASCAPGRQRVSTCCIQTLHTGLRETQRWDRALGNPCGLGPPWSHFSGSLQTVPASGDAETSSCWMLGDPPAQLCVQASAPPPGGVGGGFGIPADCVLPLRCYSCSGYASLLRETLVFPFCR